MEKVGIVKGPRDAGRQGLAVKMRREMTRHEKMLWSRLRANGLNGLHFRRQQVIDGFIADFYCHAYGLIVEADGSSHEDRLDYDTWRSAILHARGLRVVRFTNDQIELKLDAVLAEIQQAVQHFPANSEE